MTYDNEQNPFEDKEDNNLNGWIIAGIVVLAFIAVGVLVFG